MMPSPPPSLCCSMARVVGLMRMVSFGGLASCRSLCASCVTLSNLHEETAVEAATFEVSDGDDAHPSSAAMTVIESSTLVELLGLTKRSESCARSDENAADALALKQKPGLAAGVLSIHLGWQ